MSDPDQPGEDFDEDVLGDEDYPPDRYLGAESDGVTAAEEEGGESFWHRDRATEPEAWEDRPADDRDELDELVAEDDEDVGLPDDEPDLVARDAGSDPTERESASDRVPPPAEDTALHLDDDEEE
jgi:hypothetical protein